MLHDCMHFLLLGLVFSLILGPEVSQELLLTKSSFFPLWYKKWGKESARSTSFIEVKLFIAASFIPLMTSK